MTYSTASGPTKIFAHRGTTQNGAPENSVQACLDAHDAGADGIEIDVRSTRDNVLVCLHDPDIHGIPVARLTWADVALCNQTHGLEIPTLDQILAAVGPTMLLDIEIKTQGIIDQAVHQTLRHRTPDTFVVTSFIDSEIRSIKEHNDDIQAGLIVGKKDPKPWLQTRLSELFPQHRLRKARADFVAPHWRLLYPGFLAQMHSGGWPVWPWTVNAPKQIERLMKRPEIAVLITDHVTACTPMETLVR